MTGRFGDACIAGRARKPSLQCRERLDQLGRLGGAVAPAHVDLHEYAGAHETVDGLACRLEVPPDQLRRSRCREHRGAGQGLDEQPHRGTGIIDCADIDLDARDTVLNRAFLYKDRRDFVIRAGDTGRRER